MGSEAQPHAELSGRGISGPQPESGTGAADFELLADALPHMVWICDPHGSPIYLNRQGIQFLGPLLPRTYSPFPSGPAVHPDDDARAIATWAHALQTGEPLNLETRLRRADGAYLWHLSRAQPVRGPRGNITKWVGTSTNVHAAREANDCGAFLLALSTELAPMRNPQELVCVAMQRLRERLGAALVTLVELDEAQGEAVMLRQRATDGTQIDIAGLPMRPFEPLMASAREGSVITVHDVRSDSRPAFLYDRWFGLEGVGAVVSAPLLQSGSLVALLSVVDSSPRNWSDLEVELVQRVGDIVWPAFEKARSDRSVEEALKEVNQRKDEFLAMLGHELRNPLAPIRSAVQILRLHSSGNAELDWARAVIDRQTSHLSRLVDDLLDVSRIVRGQIVLQREELDLAEIIRHGVETSRPLIRSRGHRFQVRMPAGSIRVQGDLTRLAQVLANLLNNAAKYTDEQGQIWLEASLEDSQAVVRIRDTGVGIAPTLLPRIFDLFAQSERTLDRSQGGLGIGLTLVKLLVEMHGGTVQASSAGLGAGSEFVVRLPVRPVATDVVVDSAAPGDAMPGDSTSGDAVTHDVMSGDGVVGDAVAHDVMSGDGAGGDAVTHDVMSGDGAVGDAVPQPETVVAPSGAVRILVVDDNVDAADSTAMLLNMDGYETRSVHSAKAALEAAVTMRPDVVLLDIGLPEMDGYDVARRMRALTDASPPTIIAVTGYGQPADRDRATRAGFDEFLVKPVEPAVLRRLLKSLQLPER